MPVDKIDVAGDSRVEHKTAVLNGIKYHYLLGAPKDYKATIFLIHGWPDLSMGWRYQIPMLLDLGFRVVAPDLMGFGGTDAPHAPPNSMHLYAFKRAADDFEELAKQLGASKIILGGHDWGGMVVWRMAQWKPDLVTHVFAVCTPYSAPLKQYISTEDLVKGPLPQFRYQLHLASPEVEGLIKSKEDIRRFLHGIYGARGPNRELPFIPEQGVIFEVLAKVGETRLLSRQEMDYYVDEYHRNGLHGTVNWYRNRRANFDDELNLTKTKIEVPTLFVQATRDSVLRPDMARGMQNYLTDLTIAEVEATHWALWEKPEEVNSIIKKWIKQVVFAGQMKL